MKLFHKHGNKDHRGMAGIPGYPVIPFVFPMLTMLVYLGTALWLTLRLTRALETMALAKALDDMEDRLSDVEQADIEGRIRQNLFP